MYLVKINKNTFDIEQNSTERSWLIHLFKKPQELETLNKLKLILDKHLVPKETSEYANLSEQELIDKIKAISAEICSNYHPKERGISQLFRNIFHLPSNREKAVKLDGYIQSFYLPLELPNEVLAHIFDQLSTEELLNTISRVDKRSYFLADEILKKRAIEFGYQEGSEETPRQYLNSLFKNTRSFFDDARYASSYPLLKPLIIRKKDGKINAEATLQGLKNCSDRQFDLIVWHDFLHSYPSLANYLSLYIKDHPLSDLYALYSPAKDRAPYHINLKKSSHTNRSVFILRLSQVNNLYVFEEVYFWLQNAILSNDQEIVQLIIDRNIQINQLDRYKGKNFAFPTGFRLAPLHIAAMQGNVEIVRILLKKRANINNPTREYPYLDGCNLRYASSQLTPFHLAVLTNNFEVAEFLLKQGVDINRRTSNGLTALSIVAGQDRLEAFNWLLDHGAILDEACLDWAFKQKRRNIIKRIAELQA